MAGLRRKIASASDLQSVVRSMKALAASSIGQYEKSVVSLADYYRTVELGLGACLRARSESSLSGSSNGDEKKGSIGAVVFGSDQGLVGQFNEVVADYAAKELSAVPGKTYVWAIGDRVHDCLADSGLPPLAIFAMPNSVRSITSLVGQIQLALESNGSLHANARVYVFYNSPKDGALPEPVSQRLLPLDAQWEDGLVKAPWPTRNLPEAVGDQETTLRALIREYVFISLFKACAESLASENATRLAAMERADRNIDDLLENLQSRSHRIRQGSIDEELFDVVSGFEALTRRRQ